MNSVNTPPQAPSPPLWTVTLLGRLSLVPHGPPGKTITRFRTHKFAALLGFLAYHSQSAHSREMLLALLWPEMTERAARNNLSVALTSLRKQLEPPGTPPGTVLLADRFHVGLNPVAVTTDVALFGEALERADRTGSTIERSQHLLRAIALYTGPLLSGYDEDWITGERERLSGLFFAALGLLITGLEADGDLPAALSHARRGVAADPLREEGQTHLIRLLALIGQPAQALRQFREFERLLTSEMNDEPSPALWCLIRRIAKEAGLAAIPLRTIPRRPAVTVAPEAIGSEARPAAWTTMTLLLTEILLPNGDESDQNAMPPEREKPAALSALHKRIREVILRHTPAELNQAAESFTAAFTNARTALSCAIATQVMAGTLRVRTALHTGDVEGEQEPTGPARARVLHRASRLLTAAHAGQVLLSETTASLVRGALNEIHDLNGRNDEDTESVYLIDLGLHRLRDVREPEHIFQVNYPGMALAAFPPVVAEAGSEPNIPTTVTRFFGRQREIARLTQVLSDPHVPLVTITGAGGTGKTRFATEAAGQMVPYFGGAVYFVPLGGLNDYHLIPDAIIQALRLPRSPQRDPLDQAVEALRKQPALLVLDNFEHLLDGGSDMVAALLSSVTDLTVLVTSRHILDLPLGREFALSPLPTPGEAPPSGKWTAEQVSRFDSVALFVDRAQAAKPDFQITEHNAAAIAELCDRLEGIPLATELAAARAQVLSPAQMLAQMTRRFDLLLSRQRGVPERLRTLRGAMDWSYELLSPDLQHFFCQLSVFRGGWTAEAAEAVCEQPQAIDMLEDLRAASMVLSEETGEEGTSHMRFRMLETLREYGWEQLSPESLVALQRRHRRYLTEFAEAVPFGRTDVTAAEHDNLRAALTFCFDDEDGAKPGLRLAASLFEFWWWCGHWNEGRTWLGRLLHRAKAKGLGDSPEYARALLTAGRLASEQSDYAAARTLLEEALTLFKALGETSDVITTLGRLGLVLKNQGENAAATALLTEELSLSRQDGRDFTPTLFNLAGIALNQGDFDRARSLYKEILAIPGCRALGMASTYMALLAYLDGRHAEARVATEEILAGRRLAAGTHGAGRYRVAEVQYQLGYIVLAQGEYAAARASFTEALSIFRDLQSNRGIAEGLEAFACLSTAESQAERAVHLFSAAERIRSSLGAAVPFVDQQRVEAHLADVRKQLADDAFLTAWESGQSMTGDQAAAVALTEKQIG